MNTQEAGSTPPDRRALSAWALGLGVWITVSLVGVDLGFGVLIAAALAFAQTLQALLIALGRHPITALAAKAPGAARAALWLSYGSGTLIWIAVTVMNRPLTLPVVVAMLGAITLTLISVTRAREGAPETDAAED